MELIHTCYRITDPERSIAFYEALGLEKRRELPIRDEAMNYFLGVPGKPQPELELTHNFGVDSYDLGSGYGHIALTIENMDETLARLAEHGIEPERPPYSVREGGSLLCFVRDGQVEATNYLFSLGDQESVLELTYNHDGRTYDLGSGYGHIAVGVDDLDGTLERLAQQGIEPERPPYSVREGGSRLCFVQDPDGYRIELIGRS